MGWHDEREPAVYGAGERQAELQEVDARPRVSNEALAEAAREFAEGLQDLADGFAELATALSLMPGGLMAGSRTRSLAERVRTTAEAMADALPDQVMVGVPPRPLEGSRDGEGSE